MSSQQQYPPVFLDKQPPPEYASGKSKKRVTKKKKNDPRLIQCQQEISQYLYCAIEHLNSDNTFVEYTTVHHGFDPILQGYPINIINKALSNIKPQYESWALWVESFDFSMVSYDSDYDSDSDDGSDCGDRGWFTNKFVSKFFIKKDCLNLNGWFIWIAQRNSTSNRKGDKPIFYVRPPWDQRVVPKLKRSDL